MPRFDRRRERGLFVLAVLVCFAGVVSAVARHDGPAGTDIVAAAEPRTTTTRPPTTTTTEPATTTTVAPTTTTVAPTTTTAAPPTTAPPPPPPTTVPAVAPARVPAGSWSVDPYRGLGVWVDVYDWSHEFTNGNPRVGPTQVDHMAQQYGIQTMYIQTSHRKSASDVMEPSRLDAMIQRAHANGMHVVAWYLPTFEDLDKDLRRLAAAAALPVDGLGVDIEARDVTDHRERNQRLMTLSARLRDVVGDKVISAITLSAVHVQVVNPAYWPEYPWAELAAAYDVIAPMAYFTLRQGEYRNAERYIGENIDRIRVSTGRPDVPIHPIGGIANATTTGDVQGMIRATSSRGGGVLGASLYDYATSYPDLWTAMSPYRR